jgi:hypothetical protein
MVGTKISIAHTANILPSICFRMLITTQYP